MRGFSLLDSGEAILCFCCDKIQPIPRVFWGAPVSGESWDDDFMKSSAFCFGGVEYFKSGFAAGFEIFFPGGFVPLYDDSRWLFFRGLPELAAGPLACAFLGCFCFYPPEFVPFFLVVYPSGELDCSWGGSCGFHEFVCRDFPAPGRCLWLPFIGFVQQELSDFSWEEVFFDEAPHFLLEEPVGCAGREFPLVEKFFCEFFFCGAFCVRVKYPPDLLLFCFCPLGEEMAGQAIRCVDGDVFCLGLFEKCLPVCPFGWPGDYYQAFFDGLFLDAGLLEQRGFSGAAGSGYCAGFQRGRNVRCGGRFGGRAFCPEHYGFFCQRLWVSMVAMANPR